MALQRQSANTWRSKSDIDKQNGGDTYGPTLVAVAHLLRLTPSHHSRRRLSKPSHDIVGVAGFI